MKPALFLRTAVRNAPPAMREALAGAGFCERLRRRAVVGQPVNASAYLLAASMLGFDPVTGEAKRGQVVGPLHMPSLSAALRIKRIQDGTTLRQAAKAARVSYSTLGRIERGEAVSIEAIIAVCKFIGRHPFDFVSPQVSRESIRSAA